jgi:hypothetical protein
VLAGAFDVDVGGADDVVVDVTVVGADVAVFDGVGLCVVVVVVALLGGVELGVVEVAEGVAECVGAVVAVADP